MYKAASNWTNIYHADIENSKETDNFIAKDITYISISIYIHLHMQLSNTICIHSLLLDNTLHRCLVRDRYNYVFYFVVLFRMLRYILPNHPMTTIHHQLKIYKTDIWINVCLFAMNSFAYKSCVSVCRLVWIIFIISNVTYFTISLSQNTKIVTRAISWITTSNYIEFVLLTVLS